VRRRVEVVEHVERLEALGESRVSGVRFRSGGRERQREATTLVVSHGVVPQLDVASALGCELRWNERQACYEPVLDAHGGTTREHLWIAGDAGGIAGADAAQARGTLAALAAANALGQIDASRRDREAESPLHELRRALRGREFLDALYRPPAWLRRPSGSTLVCRCEEVSAQVVRDAA